MICERWPMQLPEQGADGWFLDWVLRNPSVVGRHLTAGFLAYRSLLTLFRTRELRTAREYFGGMGAQSLMVSSLFQPTWHEVIDNNPAAVAHLKEALQQRAYVRQGDAYAPEEALRADLVGLDFGDLTAWRLRPGEKQGELLARVMKAKPKAVVLTDIAGPHLAVQRQRYEALLDRSCQTYEDYLTGLAVYLREHYGLLLHHGYFHHWSAVLSLVPAASRPVAAGQLREVPLRPVGLTIARAETPGVRRRNVVR